MRDKKVEAYRAKGCCDYCPNPAIPGTHWCETHKQKHREYLRRRMQENPTRIMLANLQAKCKRTGIECSITEGDIVIPARCPVFNTPFVIGGSAGAGAQAPSIDRIDPNKGYIPGNVQVISFKANAMKQNASIADMIMLGKWAEKQSVLDTLGDSIGSKEWAASGLGLIQKSKRKSLGD